MKKFIKIVSTLLVAALLTACMAAFVACGGDDDKDKVEYATDKIYITIVDEDGNPIDGTTFGEDDWDETNHQVMVQFCTLDGGCATMVAVDANGKAVYDLSAVKSVAEAGNTDTVELHVQKVAKVGYKVEYGQYKVNEIPKEITVKLVKA